MADLKLSASRIKNYEGCSYKYYCTYNLKLPSSTNSGANRGNVCHEILECLLKEERKSLATQLVGDIKSSKALNRLVPNLAKKYNVYNKADIDLIYKFLHTALKTDFYLTGSELQPPEYQFDIGNPEVDGYSCRGYIDKYGVYPDLNLVKICDYKSSKSIDLDSHELQAMVYSLAMLKKYPEYKSEVNFIFLKFPKNPVRSLSYTKNQLTGFEEYLRAVFKQLSNFSYEDAKSNYAANGQLWRMHCGTALYPGELKEDGSVKHACSYKFPFVYFAVVDEFGQNIRTAMSLNELKAKADEEVMQKRYGGCPFWKDKLNFS